MDKNYLYDIIKLSCIGRLISIRSLRIEIGKSEHLSREQSRGSVAGNACRPQG